MDAKLSYLLDIDTYIVLDLETTGLSPELNDIIEIAAIKFTHGKEVERFHSMINPSHRIPEEITQLTGITNDDVQDAPILEEKLQELFEFLGDFPLCGHNVDFDLSFIEYAIRKASDDFDGWKDKGEKYKYLVNKQLDTRVLSSLLYPYLYSHKLTELSAHFNLTHTHAHRAMDDVEATAALFSKCIEDLIKSDIRPLRTIVKVLEPTEHPNKWLFINCLNAKLDGHLEEQESLFHMAKHLQQGFNIIGKATNKDRGSSSSFKLIQEDDIDAIFSNEGSLSTKLSGYEARAEQIQLSKAIAQAFNEGLFLVSEAGTGTGKSLSYLIPSALWATRNRKNNARVVISTNTKNLQEQLFFKDLPLVQSLFQDDFQAVLLKGKGNYLCLDKWTNHIEGGDGSLSAWDRNKMLPLIFWKEYTQTGDISENSAFHVEHNGSTWSKFIAENNYCSGKKCKFYGDCHLIKARNAAKEADIVVINHSLLFSSLNAENSILGDYKNLIFDEAHNIEKVATDYLGSELNIWMFRRVANTLYQGEKSKKTLLLRLFNRLDQSKLIMDSRVNTTLLDTCERAMKYTDSFTEDYINFFDEASKLLRIKHSGLNKFEKLRYEDGTDYFSIIEPQIKALSRSLDDLYNCMSQIHENLKEVDEETFPNQLQLTQEVISVVSELSAINSVYSTILNAGLEDYVFWAEPPAKLEQNDCKFYMAPIHINDLLHRTLYSKLETAVFTSATMTVKGQFDYFKKRTGLSFIENAQLIDMTVGSPFNYEKQAEVRLANFLYDPSHQMYNQSLVDLLIKVCKERENGVLMLFTSYYMLNEVYNACKYQLESLGYKPLAQGKDGSRTKLVSLLKSEKKVVLFGADSFWEGVDVPGDALETVIITKLPFAVPSDPVVAAKMDEIKKRDGNPFMEYSVPEAVIKFRQGFGRLIRTMSDKGIVYVTDNRLVNKRYGRIFLDSLPIKETVFNTEKGFYTPS